MEFIAVMAMPLLACLLLALMLPTLGRHVLARGVIFVDLALAQIAALGASVAFLLGAEPHDPSMYLWSFGFTILGAALLSFLWDRNHSVLQEAFIGISFALATAATLILLSNAPHGAEHVQGSLGARGGAGVGGLEGHRDHGRPVRRRRGLPVFQPVEAGPVFPRIRGRHSAGGCRSRSGTSCSTSPSGWR